MIVSLECRRLACGFTGVPPGKSPSTRTTLAGFMAGYGTCSQYAEAGRPVAAGETPALLRSTMIGGNHVLLECLPRCAAGCTFIVIASAACPGDGASPRCRRGAAGDGEFPDLLRRGAG